MQKNEPLEHICNKNGERILMFGRQNQEEDLRILTASSRCKKKMQLQKGEPEVLVESKAYVLNLRNSFKIECSAKLFFDMISSRILFSFFLRQKEILS